MSIAHEPIADEPMTEEMKRKAEMDAVFSHLRKQDEAIAAIRSDIEFVVFVSKNLEGFSNFCARWGQRLNKFLKWLALVGPGLIALWQMFGDAIKAFFVRHP